MTGKPVLVFAEYQKCMKSHLFPEVLIGIREMPTTWIGFGHRALVINQILCLGLQTEPQKDCAQSVHFKSHK